MNCVIRRIPHVTRRGGWIGPSRHAAHQRANATNRAAWWVDRPILPRRPAGAWEWKYHHGYLLGKWGREIMALPLRPWGPLCQWIHRALCPLLFMTYKRVSNSASCAVHLKCLCCLVPVLLCPYHFGSSNCPRITFVFQDFSSLPTCLDLPRFA